MWLATSRRPYRQSRKDRKNVEMLFAYFKRILNLTRLRLRGMNGARDEFLLAAAAQNLRRPDHSARDAIRGSPTHRGCSPGGAAVMRKMQKQSTASVTGADCSKSVYTSRFSWSWKEHSMKVGVLGSGDVGKVLAAGFLAHGHNVMVGTRTPAKLKDWAKDNPRALLGTFADAARIR